MDALSEVLKVVQLNGAVFFNAKFTAPWSFAAPDAASGARQLRLGSSRLLVYHFLVEGACTVQLEGMAPVQLKAGDVILFPQGDAHTMGSSLWADPASLLNVQQMVLEKSGQLEMGGGGALTHFICGYLACDPILCRPVLEALPRVVVVSTRGGGQTDWLENCFLYALAEAGATAPGGEGVLAKLSEVLVVEALRRYISQITDGQTGWFAGLRDGIVGKCMALMHARPERPWTLEGLAREVGTSRSVLAERFTHYVGQTPMQYLAKWRMALASNLVRRSSLNMLNIALEVGYETDAAFSRAFKREFGMPPAAWRREHNQAAATVPA